jgi:hypothetical protein
MGPRRGRRVSLSNSELGKSSAINARRLLSPCASCKRDSFLFFFFPLFIPINKQGYSVAGERRGKRRNVARQESAGAASLLALIRRVRHRRGSKPRQSVSSQTTSVRKKSCNATRRDLCSAVARPQKRTIGSCKPFRFIEIRECYVS